MTSSFLVLSAVAGSAEFAPAGGPFRKVQRKTQGNEISQVSRKRDSAGERSLIDYMAITGVGS